MDVAPKRARETTPEDAAPDEPIHETLVWGLPSSSIFLGYGMSEKDLLDEVPQLTHEDILAAIAYGAEVARQRIIPVPTETGA